MWHFNQVNKCSVMLSLLFISSAKLGANAILGVSLAVCKAGAASKGVPLYQHIASLAGNSQVILPCPVSVTFIVKPLVDFLSCIFHALDQANQSYCGWDFSVLEMFACFACNN